MLHNRPFKKITVTGQTVNKEYILAVHNPKDIDYSGVYALKLKAAGKLFRVDFSIAGDNEISHSDVNIGILNIVDNNSGIGTTQTAFNNNFTLKVVQSAAGLNLIVIRMLTVIMGGSFEMTISNSVPTGLDWSDYGKYIGKDYSTIAGYPFANETVKSPVKILGGINAPEVTTTAATSVTSSGMILNASLTTLGSEASVYVAFDWRLVGAGSWTRTSLVAKTTIGTFSATLSGLSSNTTYEYRAVVIGQSNPGNDAIGVVLPQLTVAINIDADSGVNITGTSGGSALNTTNIPSVTNGAVNNGTGLMTATADNCVSQTVEIAQQGGQSDFQLLKTTFALAPYQMTIDPATTSSSIVVSDQYSGKLSNGAKLWLESAGVMKLVQAASVTEALTATLGDSWTSITSSFASNKINKVHYANGIFVAVGDNGKIATSIDGYNWTQRSNSFNSSTNILDVFYANGIWMAVGGTSSSTSSDGITWNSLVSTGITARAIGYGSGRWVILGGSSQMESKTSTNNGSSWASIPSMPDVNLGLSIIYANNLWVGGTNGSGVVYSSDGLSWTNTGIGSGGSVWQIIYESGNFYACVYNKVASSANGTSWALNNTNFTGDIQAISYANGTFVIAGTSGALSISSNLSSWTPKISTFGTSAINGITYGNNRLVVVGASGKSAVSLSEYRYTCTSLTSLFGGAITTTPTLAYKAGQSFESSITATSGTSSYVADTLYSISRSGNILTLIFNQRSATGRYVRSKAAVNKGDVISRYAIDLWN